MKNKIIKLISGGLVLSSSGLVLAGCGCHQGTTKIIVKFDTQGGSTIADAEVNAEGKVSRPADPTKTGYHFINWYTNSSCTGEAFNFNTKITQSMTLYAKWTINTYTVIFDTQGGSEIASQEIKAGGKVTKPTDPTKEDVKFGGWYENKECTGDAFDFNTKINKSLVLYAKWNELADCTVTFDSMGGTVVESVTVKEGKTISQPTNPTKEDCEFVQWNDDEGNKFDFSTPITSNITLYAQWQAAQTVTVTFNSMGGSEVQAQHVKRDSTATRPTDPTLTNMKFVDWYDNEGCSGDPFDFTTPITASKTLYAKWRQTVTKLTVKSDIPSIHVSETTTWSVNDYIDIEPAELAEEYKGLKLDLSFVDTNYVEAASGNTLFVKSAPTAQSSTVSYEITVRSVDNSSVYVKFPLTYERMIENNLEVSYYDPDTNGYGIRAADKSQVSGTLNIPATITYESYNCNIESIDDSGFSGCTNLTTLTFSDNTKFKYLDRSAFASCPNLSSISLPDSTKWIGTKAFLIEDDETLTPTLESITLPSSLTVIDQNSFQGQSKLKTITIPKTVQKIDSYAFNKCTSLTSIVIPDESEITWIGHMAFANCTNLQSISKLPKTFVKDVEQSTTTGLGNGVFANCTNLSEIGVDSDNPTYKVFGDLTYGMALAAWYELDGVTYHELICYPKATGELTISDDWDLNSICSGCFAGTTITKLYLPNTLLRMKYAAFDGCKTLKQLFLGEHYSEWKWDGATRTPPFLSDEEEAKRSVNVNIVTSPESSYYSLIRY